MDEAELCDGVVLIDRGAVVAAGTPAALKSEIGGDVITIESGEPEALRGSIRERFGIDAAAVDGSLRLERRNGHSLIPQLVEAFPGMVRSVSLAKPSLEDVFIHHTGHRFWEERRP
jgi:ABC-2 type transport system ATP-binding protein